MNKSDLRLVESDRGLGEIEAVKIQIAKLRAKLDQLV